MPKIKVESNFGDIEWNVGLNKNGVGKKNIWDCKLLSKTNNYFYLFNIGKHKQLKNKLLKNIKDTPFTETYNNVSKTDWEIDCFLERKYWDKNVIDIFENCTDILKKNLYGSLDIKDKTGRVVNNFNQFKTTLHNYWYHLYKKNSNYHWHTHGCSNFSAIYYISLPEKKYKTQFLNMNMPVKEGDLLIFPSFLAHCSPINKSNKEKVILSINFSII